MSESTTASFGGLPLQIEVTRVRFESPLWFETSVRVAKTASALLFRHFKTLYRRIYFGDLERQRVELDNAVRREDVIAARIKNIEAAYQLIERIRDPRVREAIKRHLVAAIAPFDPVLSELRPDRKGRRKLIAAEIVDSDDDGHK